jgi:hypothetical protein
VSTAAATAVAFAVAAVLSFYVPRRFRSLLVVAVLVVPIAIAVPGFVRTERRDAAASARASVYTPPLKWRQTNTALLAGIVAHVPAHESVSVVNGNLETGWLRWLAYSIAPRQLMAAPARWTIFLGEAPVLGGHPPLHAWRYGHDWLVER